MWDAIDRCVATCLNDEQWQAQTSAARLDRARRRRARDRHRVDAAGRCHAGGRHRRVDAQARAQRHRRDERAVGAQAARRSARRSCSTSSARRRPSAARRCRPWAMAQWNELTATPAGPDSYGRFMRVRDFDCWMHQHDIRDAVGPPRQRRPRRARRPGWRWMRWRPAWASSSASSAARPTGRGWRSS